MKTSIDRHWIRFVHPKQSSSFTGDLAGKYLFFCKEQNSLIDIAKTELTEHGFEIAKVSTTNKSGDYVLCLYWHDDSRKRELFERYKNEEHLKYRWWKSNSDTRAGKYSKQFTACKETDLENNLYGCDSHWDQDYDSEMSMFNDEYDSHIFH